MKNLALCLGCLCLLGTSVLPANAQSTPTPYPPALRHIEKHPPVIESPAPPPAQQIDLVQLRRDAEELAKLSQSVPVDMEQIANGLLPKDVVDKLKRIEKLSKRLHGELLRFQ
jgi:hypothetical protein